MAYLNSGNSMDKHIQQFNFKNINFIEEIFTGDSNTKFYCIMKYSPSTEKYIKNAS